MKIFIGILIALVVVIGGIHLIAPKTYLVEREIIINKPQSEVFNHIKFLKEQRAWNPWLKLDPNVKYGEIGTDGTVGFITSWEGNSKVGAGEQEIKSITDGKRIDTELRFKKPMEDVAQGYVSTEAVNDNQTKVKWSMSGNYKFPGTVICFLMQMDKKIGGDFEEGLSMLKTQLEKN